MKIAAFPNSSGSAYWRLHDPFKYMRSKGVEAHVADEAISDRIALWADIVTLQGCVDKEGIALLRAYQVEQNLRIVVDMDDLLELKDDNPYQIDHKITNATEIIKITMKIADMVTCTTPYLADKLKVYNKNVVVLPNMMDLERWDLPKLKNDSDTIRIGWVGSKTHFDDFNVVVEPLKRIMDEYPQVRLILMGDPRIKKYFEGYPVEAMLGVPFDAYPSKLNGLRLDIGIAPLEDNEFNKCKSNIKFLEYAISKVPTVLSPTAYYPKSFNLTFDGTFGMIAYDKDQWYRCIKNYIISKNLRDDIVEHAYAFVAEKYNLEKNIQPWIDAYSSLLQN